MEIFGRKLFQINNINNKQTIGRNTIQLKKNNTKTEKGLFTKYNCNRVFRISSFKLTILATSMRLHWVFPDIIIVLFLSGEISGLL